MILEIYDQEFFINGVLQVISVKEIPMHVVVDTAVLIIVLDVVSKFYYFNIAMHACMCKYVIFA